MKTNRFILLLSPFLFFANPLLSQTVPENDYQIEDNGLCFKITEWDFGRRPKGSSVKGKKSRTKGAKNLNSPYSSSFNEGSAIGITITLDSEAKVKGLAQVSGEMKGTIQKGLGYIEGGIHAKSKITYADQKVIAEGKNSLFITIKGSPKTIGMGGQIAGTGINFIGTFIEIGPKEEKSIQLFDADMGMTKKAKEVNILLIADASAHLWLEGGAMGSVSGSASAGALIVLSEPDAPIKK